MHRATVLAALALMAVAVLAAPMPDQGLSKRGIFKAQSKPRIHPLRSQRNPAAEMLRAFRKYGWEIITIDPSSIPFAGIFGDGSSSSTPSSPSPSSSSAAPWYPLPTSSAAVYPTQASSAPIVTSTAASNSTTESSEASWSSSSTTAATSTAASGGDDDVTGEVAAAPEDNDSEYLSPVSIGGQKLNLDFDTGSADLWVFSSELPSSKSRGHSTFNPSKSSSWSDYEDGSWEISYGDGSSAAGTVGYDTVTIGGATVTKQAVEIATAVSGSFVTDTNNDGLVGLAFSTINTVQPTPQKTWFENIMADLAQPLFTANLAEDTSGSYTFGEIDSSEYTGDIHYTTIDKSNGFWQFDSSTYTIAGQSSQCSTCSPMIADTGTSLLLVDEDVAEAYYAQVSSAQYDSSQGGYVYDCSEDLPAFGVAIGDDYTAVLKGDDVTFAEIYGGSCFGGVQGNAGGGIQILGDVMLKQFLAVFDGGNSRFGVAEKA